jgi:hypothetical protein
MTLPMTPRVYETFVVDVVCSTLTCGDDMIHFYVFSGYKRDGTQSASISLSLVQHQPLFLVGFPSHLSLLALQPVLAQRRIIGRVSSCDLCVAGDRGYIGFHQFRLVFLECPIAIVFEIASFHPFTSLVRVSAFCPVPEHLPLGMSNLLEDVLGCRVPVIIRPSAYNRIECLNDPHRRGLLMCVQGGSSCSQVFEHFFLLWDGQHFFLPAPEFPEMEPEEVKPFFDMHHSGFRFIERQSSFLEEFFQAWSGVGFQYFPCWGRCHTVISVSNDRYPFVESFAEGWGFGSSIWPFGFEQPFHPIQCHICQQGRKPSSYTVANFFFQR